MACNHNNDYATFFHDAVCTHKANTHQIISLVSLQQIKKQPAERVLLCIKNSTNTTADHKTVNLRNS